MMEEPRRVWVGSLYNERIADKADIVQAKPNVMWTCGTCGANLLTSERRGARVVANTVKCRKCFTTNSLQEIKWRGQP